MKPKCAAKFVILSLLPVLLIAATKGRSKEPPNAKARQTQETKNQQAKCHTRATPHPGPLSPFPGAKGELTPSVAPATEGGPQGPGERAPSTDEVALLKQQLALQQKQIEELRVALKEQKQLLERAIQTGQVNRTALVQSSIAASTPSQQNSGLGTGDCRLQIADCRFEILNRQSSIFNSEARTPNPETRIPRQVASTTPAVPTAPATATTIPEVSPLPVAHPSAPAKSLPQYSQPAAGAEDKKSPLTLRIGDADFMVGGFVDATAFFRSSNLGSGIGTSFGSIPLGNTPQGRLSEMRFTAQNSRLNLMATSKVGANNVKGYVETDFLGVQPANGFVTSNSNSLRMRLYWLDLTRGKFELLAGQSWSMLNPNRSGLSPLPSDIFYSQNMDTNYQVGLTWTRQAQVRFIYHPGKEWAAGISLENPQQFVGAAVLPPDFNAAEVDNGGNVGAPNLHPDIIAKVAWDPMVADKHMHVEVAGLLSSFRTFSSTTGASTTATGGGGSVNFNLEAAKNLHLILNTFHSDGGGRYIFGLGPDLIVKADGSPSLVHAGSGIGGFEYQVNPRTMFYGYYGGAYYQRNTAIFIDPTTQKASLIGFGFPGSPSSHNRSIQEGTFGIIQTFWKNPRYGALQLITQYSYLTRNPWSVAKDAPKNAHTSMGYVDVRYLLP